MGTWPLSSRRLDMISNLEDSQSKEALVTFLCKYASGTIRFLFATWRPLQEKMNHSRAHSFLSVRERGTLRKLRGTSRLMDFTSNFLSNYPRDSCRFCSSVSDFSLSIKNSTENNICVNNQSHLIKRLRLFSHHDALTSSASWSMSDCFALEFDVASRYLT